MANKILQIDLQNDITPQIGSYDNVGGVTPNNWRNDDYAGVYSLGPTNGDGRTPYYWFTPTREVTDFDLCWEDYQDHSQTTTQFHLEIGDSAGNVVLSAFRQHANYSIGPVNVGELAYQTWHKILVEVRKASASSSTVTIYVNGKKAATGTSDTLLTSAKIALLGHVPNIFYMQNAGQRLRYVTIYDRSYTSKGINLDGMMTIVTGLLSKLITKLSTVAFTGSYNDLSNKPTISTVNNATLTIQQNGTTVNTFTANSSSDKTVNIQCVDLTNNQTVAGNKEFTDLQTIRYGTRYKGNKDAYILPEFSAGYSGLSITTLSFSQTLKIGNFVLDDNNKPVLDTSKAYIQVATGANNNVNTCLMEPRNSTSSSLGTSANKWTSFNGVEPSNLSLPSDTSITIDTTGFTWGRNFTFTPSVNGHLFISISSSNGIRALSLKTGRGEYYFTNQTGILRFTMPVYKGKIVTILAISTEAETVIPGISLFPCQGNV